MLGVKKTSVSSRRYYTSMKNTYTERKLQAEDKIKRLTEEIKSLRDTILESYNDNNELYKCDVTKFKEFNENKYVNGELYRTAKGILINKDGNFELVGAAYDLYKLADYQKTIHELEKELIRYNKLLSLGYYQYVELLRVFYNKVQEKMILEGCGYGVTNVGWICINRCKYVDTKKKAVDFAATNKRKQELLEQGVKLYNRKEAEWCKAHGIEYTGVDYRVYQKVDAYYEIPLLGITVTGPFSLKFLPLDYTHPELRKLKYEGIKALCGGDVNKICKLDLDIRAKLQLCLDADKTLYTKFIRNENQKPYLITKIGRKDRQ